jgi:hypothetical protein
MSLGADDSGTTLAVFNLCVLTEVLASFGPSPPAAFVTEMGSSRATFNDWRRGRTVRSAS